MAGVLAAGMNAWYHDGGFSLAHRVEARLQHGSAAVLALASGRADEFLTQAQRLSVDESPRCNLAANWDRFEVVSAREREQLDRLAAKRVRMEAQMRMRADRMQVAAVTMRPLTFRLPPSRPIVVLVPRTPRVEIPAVPVIESLNHEPI